MNAEELLQQFPDYECIRLDMPLPDDVAACLVERLKAEADRHWRIDPHCSLEYAEQIVQIGRARHDCRQIALGAMARGDALRYLGRIELAWESLEEAGELPVVC